jgi:hypothetical protein
MKRLCLVFAATAVLAACGSAAAGGRQVASLSTTAVGAQTGDTTGDSGDSSATTEPVDPSEAPLKYAKCMREHGIDMPDPQVSDGGGVMVQIGGPPGSGEGPVPDPKELDAANKECQHFMEDAAAGFTPPSEEDQKKMQEQALTFAKCMRDHGIDMPDPQFSADGGGFSVSIGGPDSSNPADNGPAFDFNSKEFKDASEACGGPGGGGFAIATGTVPG